MNGYGATSPMGSGSLAQVLQPGNAPRATLYDDVGGIDKLLEDAHGAITNLEQKLGIVLQPEAPTPDSSKSVSGPQSAVSDLRARLQQHASLVHALISRLNRLSNRIDF